MSSQDCSKDKYEERKRLIDFIDMVEAYTESWDDMCDCGCKEGYSVSHIKGCQTLNFRSDCHYALTGERREY